MNLDRDMPFCVWRRRTFSTSTFQPMAKRTKRDDSSLGKPSKRPTIPPEMEMSEDDPGLAFSYAPDAAIHAILGIAGSPVPQGPNAAASSGAFRAWVAGLLPPASAVVRAGVPLDDRFHHLSLTQVHTFFMAINVFHGWVHGIQLAGLSAGRLDVVTAAGVGSCTMSPVTMGPFL